jgi:hypothetical protein
MKSVTSVLYVKTGFKSLFMVKYFVFFFAKKVLRVLSRHLTSFRLSPFRYHGVTVQATKAEEAQCRWRRSSSRLFEKWSTETDGDRSRVLPLAQRPHIQTKKTHQPFSLSSRSISHSLYCTLLQFTLSLSWRQRQHDPSLPRRWHLCDSVGREGPCWRCSQERETAADATPLFRDVGVAAAVAMTIVHLFSASVPCRSATEHMATRHTTLMAATATHHAPRSLRVYSSRAARGAAEPKRK